MDQERMWRQYTNTHTNDKNIKEAQYAAMLWWTIVVVMGIFYFAYKGVRKLLSLLFAEKKNG